MPSDSRSIDVFLLPENTTTVDLTDCAAVLIDVLRATTTMVTAIESGAAAVVPCCEIDEARQVAAQFPDTLLGGERGGVRIDGFNLGNSPTEYSPEAVAGKKVVLTTTNGTAALHLVRSARRILIGAFVNVTAVANELRDEQHVVIVCAGTDGFVTGEDTMAAGAIAQQLCQAHPDAKINDQCQIAMAAWNAVGGPDHKLPDLVAALLRTHGGLNLSRIGMEADVEFCAVVDRFDTVPVVDPNQWQIVATDHR